MEKAVIDLIEESSLGYEKNDTKLVRDIISSASVSHYRFLGIGKSRRSSKK